jgi:hypothetical protein
MNGLRTIDLCPDDAAIVIRSNGIVSVHRANAETCQKIWFREDPTRPYPRFVSSVLKLCVTAIRDAVAEGKRI